MGIKERKIREKEIRRKEILTSAEKLFSGKKGIDATMEDLAEKTELGKGTLYLYFPNKESILQALAEKGINLLKKRLVRAMDNSKTGAEQLSDNGDAFALVRAKNAGIETLILDPNNFRTREELDGEIVINLRKKKVGLIVLAGFMRLLSPYFIKEYKGKIMNIHPALLPSFKGTHGIKDALDYGVKVTGPTVHFVDEELDHGAIILQKALDIKDDDTEESLLERVHQEEHRI